jgi:hypothetical protein
MRCQVCGTGEQRDGAECDYCGATVRSVLGKGMPLPPGIRDEIDANREKNRERVALARKSRLFWHAVTGAIILFAVCVLANVAAFLFAPRGMMIGILISIPISLVFGPLMGFVISWLNWGGPGGAVVGFVCFTAALCLSGTLSLLMSAIVSVIPGSAVGGFIGVHVQSDKD